MPTGAGADGSTAGLNGSSVSSDTYFSDPGSYGGDDGDDGPVVLDLTGNGINLTQLTSSNTFHDMTGDGYENRTAWAGAGNAVLFVDPNNTHAITKANQIVFTDWDPTASTDMQALLDVFDTNHDGSLDAGDADFADFKLMVTNANGTQSVETLAQAGITSINLTTNNVSQTFADGSSIDGETTSGTTGAAATVTFADDSNGYAIQSTTVTHSDGSVTIDISLLMNIDMGVKFGAHVGAELAKKLKAAKPDIVVGTATLGIPVAIEVSRHLELDRYVILQKSPKIHLGDALVQHVESVTSIGSQRLLLDRAAIPQLAGKRVVVDDVVATGSSLAAAVALVRAAGGFVVAVGVILTEAYAWREALGADAAMLVALGHIPQFTIDGKEAKPDPATL